MKELTQREFEEQIKRVIDGEISRKKLAEELDTEIRTLNNRIMKLSDSNQELYKEFIKKFPYKPKKIDIDVETLAINVIKYGIQKVADQTKISTRTIIRKIKQLEKTNPKLYELYKNRKGKMSFDDNIYIDQEISKKGHLVIERKEISERKRELENTITKFEELVESGMSRDKAAKMMGYDGYSTIWKKYKELDRIKIEERLNEKDKSYRDSLKVNGKEPLIRDVTRIEHSNLKIQEQRER